MADKQPKRSDDDLLRGRKRPPAVERVPNRQQAQPPRKRRRRKKKPLSVPWWGFLLVIVLVGGITCGLWAYVLSLRSDPVAELGPTSTAVFVVITATPTLGSSSGDLEGGQPVAPTATLPAAPTATSPPENLQIEVGSEVYITGTGGDGLSIRQGPGRNYGIFAIGQDGDTFVVEDGPREADGFVWWYIIDPTDEDRAGWAVQNFIAVAP